MPSRRHTLPHLRSLAAVLAALAATLAPPAAGALGLCTSDGQPRATAVLERFTSADCERCWRDPAVPRPGPGELVLDWIVPGERGEDAPLSMGATRDSLERLRHRRQPVPAAAASIRTPSGSTPARLRIAQGPPVNDYVGTLIELRPGEGAWDAWLLLVEALPAGAEGSPVARNVVRNAFRPDWNPPPAASRGAALQERRSMQIAEGARPSRLRLVALLHDPRGRLVAAVQSHCEPE